MILVKTATAALQLLLYNTEGILSLIKQIPPTSMLVEEQVG